MVTNSHDDMHAGELETSILLATAPEYLRDGWQHDDHEARDRRDLLLDGIAPYTTSGVIGRPSLATADKGRLALAKLAENGTDTGRQGSRPGPASCSDFPYWVKAVVTIANQAAAAIATR